MTVPDYQTLMAPALQALADGTEQPISQLRGAIAKQIGLTDADLKVTLPARGPSDSVHESRILDRRRPTVGHAEQYRRSSECARRLILRALRLMAWTG